MSTTLVVAGRTSAFRGYNRRDLTHLPLLPGVAVGPYEVIAALGAGGMGEVYRARDTRLKRDVALKVLPEGLSQDPDRLARFQREAELLATLNHPNIAAVYGLEKADALIAIVLELVEGETLADLIARGPLAISEALPLARQIAEALEAAHEKGVVHRDLKPANIKITPDGKVKVLDFGLAKLVEAGGVGGARAVAGLSMSPTLSVHATYAGVILGTAAYMSPEQARGKPVDRRTDIWAFGCVLFEMLTGQRTFEPGETVSDAIASVLSREPDWNALPAATPAHIRTLLRRCLQKDPQQRLPHIGVARLEIDEGPVGPTGSSATVAQPVAPQPRWRRAVPWIVAATSLAAAGAALVLWAPWRTASSPEPVAFTIDTPASSNPFGFTVSPDGRSFAFVAADRDGQQKLWIRPLGSITPRMLAGTDGATFPFWSPDSRQLAFFMTTELRRVDIETGTIQLVCRTIAGTPFGGTWNDRNVILFARGTNIGGMWRVSGDGGEPEPIATISAQGSYRYPAFLPDGRRFLYVKPRGADPGAPSGLMMRALDSAEETVVGPWTSKTLYASGYLLYRLNGPLVAQLFDPSSGTTIGDPGPVGPEILSDGANEAAFSVSTSGLLAYRTEQGGAAAMRLSWVDRDGKVVTPVSQAGNYSNPAVGSIGVTAVADFAAGGGANDVWVFDTRRNTTSRLTFDPTNDSDAIVSPDGRWIAFYSARNGGGIYRKASSGAGADELVAASGLATFPRDWSWDGRFILYDNNTNPANSIDLWIVPVQGDRPSTSSGRPEPAEGRKPFAYLSTRFSERQGHFSPDGRWIAYTSDETGRDEVFVQAFPVSGAKFQVSPSGGTEPRWRRDGRELYYLGSDGRMMAVDVELQPEFRLGVPRALFQTGLMGLLPSRRRYGVTADGRRFLMNVPVGDQEQAPITVTLNWTALLNPR